MALPGGVGPRRRQDSLPYGVSLSMEAGDSFFDIEILRAPDSTGTASTASAVTVAVIPGTSTGWADFLPNDNTFRHYAARHVLDGYPNGPESTWLRARPVRLAL